MENVFTAITIALTILSWGPINTDTVVVSTPAPIEQVVVVKDN